MELRLALLMLLGVASAATIHCDVVVIGGGGSGAHFAVFASDNGYNVCVLEKRAQLGGHCTDRSFSPPFQGKDHVSLGVLLVHNTTRNNERGFGNYTVARNSGGLVGHFARFGEIEPFPVFGNLESYSMDVENNIGVTPPTPSPPEFLQAFITEVANYLQTTYPQLEEATSADVVPTLLTKNAVEFFASEPFLGPRSGVVTGTSSASGIVPFSEVSGWDIMRGVVPSLLMGSIEEGWMVQFKHGCRAIYNNLTHYLQTEADQRVFLNATVTKITRPSAEQSNGKVLVHFKVNDGETQLIIADKLVVAIPPTLKNLEEIGLKPKPQEHAVFQHVVVSKGYFGAELESNSTFYILSNSNTQKPLGEVNFDLTPMVNMICEYVNASGNFGPCHGTAASTDEVTDEEMADRIRDQLALMTLLPNPVFFTLTELVRHEDYFPHFVQQALQNDPTLYGKLNALQGQFNTHWIGAGPSYADRTLVIEHTNRIAQQFFPNLAH